MKNSNEPDTRIKWNLKANLIGGDGDQRITIRLLCIVFVSKRLLRKIDDIFRQDNRNENIFKTGNPMCGYGLNRLGSEGGSSRRSLNSLLLTHANLIILVRKMIVDVRMSLTLSFLRYSVFLVFALVSGISTTFQCPRLLVTIPPLGGENALKDDKTA